MAEDTNTALDKQRSDLQNQEGQLEPKPQDNSRYIPNKRNRQIRRRVYERFYNLRDDPLRQEAEREWDIADKEFGMVTPDLPMEDDDWHADLHLPDAFSAIQTQSQETIERKSRPKLNPTEESDEPRAEFINQIMNYNMNNTGFDYQRFLGKLSASSRGTAFYMDYWRTDKRTVKDPTSYDPDTGKITYKDKEIVDFDDDYTEWKPNEFIFVDEKAKHIDEAIDMVEREVINIEEFHRVYGNKAGFFDTEYVVPGGETTTRSVFKLPKDITERDVEVLHYYNRSIDAYWCVANNVTIYDDPLPTKHKELPVAVEYQYRMPGRFWGIGIPRVLHMLSEERRSLRNINIDRQKIIVSGAFLHNNSFDIDEEDETLRPGGWINIDTNGQSVDDAVKQVQMSDVPASYFRTEEILLEDIRRASGIDDRVVVSNSATTATQAAIVKESTLKRINLISISNEMDTLVRLGKLKWSNIQFFYGTPRIESVTEDKEEKEKKVYRTLSVSGKKFSVVDDHGKKSLRMEDVKGNSAVTLEPDMAKFMEGDVDVYVDADIYNAPSKAIDQTKKNETFSLLLSNPATMAVMDINRATADLLKTNNISPDVWLKNAEGNSKKDMMMLADAENLIMSAGQPLSGTKDATEDHTLVHLMYTKTAEYQELPMEVQQVVQDHIMQEYDNNPATGNSADLLSAHGLTPKPELVPAGLPGALPAPSINADTAVPQAQPADLQATNYANPE